MKENKAKTVKNIISRVKKHGDKALFALEKKFNGVSLNRRNIKLTAKDFIKAYKGLSSESRGNLKRASENIFSYNRQIRKTFRDIKVKRKGLSIVHRQIPLNRVAVYVPGGRYLYPSSVLMNVIPARAAGVSSIYAATAGISAEVLACCYLSGVTALYRISGAQAIAAFAYGSGSVPKVDFIAGPGNSYVTEAKRQVSGDVGIDLLAGPSEIVVMADDSVKKEWVLADIAAQLEHDPQARAYLITPSVRLHKIITVIIEKKLPSKN